MFVPYRVWRPPAIGVIQLGVVYWHGQDAGFAVLSTVVVPDHAVVLGAFASEDLPWETLLAQGIHQAMAGRSAHNEAELTLGQFLQPGSASVAPIKKVDHPLLPTLGASGQQCGGLRSPVAGQGASAGPPTHGSQGGRARHPSHYHREPLHPRHEYGRSSRRVVVARLDPLETGRLAGAHRTQPLQGDALRLLQDTLIRTLSSQMANAPSPAAANSVSRRSASSQRNSSRRVWDQEYGTTWMSAADC